MEKAGINDLTGAFIFSYFPIIAILIDFYEDSIYNSNKQSQNKDKYMMGWVSLGLTLLGAIIALAAGFGTHSLQYVVVGIVIAIIGLLFKPSRI